MADYIYLMQTRLTPAQWRALEAVRETARTHNMPVFLVGGAVRDLTSGAPVRDLDFAIQGEARSLVGDLESRGAAVAGEHPVLSSIYFTFRGGVRAEIGPTLSVSYPKPGKPEAKTATILDDLRRRDFTANAMAVSLNEGSYGLLLDPLNGTADIENRELRLVSPYGFIEQPALLPRVARLSERLGWSMEERTQGRYETGREEEHIKALPAWDRGYELEEIFHEEDPLAAMEHMEAEGWREVLFPALNGEQADRSGMDEVRELIGQLESQRLYPDPSAVYFPLITAKLSEENRTSLKKLFAREGFVRQIETIEARSKELANQLLAKSTPQASDAWRLLMETDPEVTLWLAFHSRSAAVQTRIKAFLKEWPGMRGKIPYAVMQEMRITPDLPGYEQLLDDLFFALIDGKLDTPEATRAFLEPFSPPAPPQVSVRRRPAKSARGRGKRAAEPVPAEPEETEEAEDADEADAEVEENESETDSPAPMPFRAPEPEASQGMDEDAEDDHTEAPTASAEPERDVETSPAVMPATAPDAPEAGSNGKPSGKGERAPDPVKPASKAVVKAPIPAKSAPHVKAAAPKDSAGKKGSAPATDPTTATTASKGAPASKKAVPPTKQAAKFVVVHKPAVKAPVAAVKAPAKKTPPVTVPVKLAASVKAVAHKGAVKGGGPAPVKATAPAKAAKVANKATGVKVAAKVPSKVVAKVSTSLATKAAAKAPVKAAKKAASKGRAGR